MKEIKLRNCHATVWVDDEDYERLSQHTWAIGSHGYAQRRFTENYKTKKIFMHREVLRLSDSDERVVDHKNGDALDNQKENLRACSASDNQFNRQGSNATYRGRPTASRYRNVYRSGNNWMAIVRFQGKRHYLGSFSSEKEASNCASQFREEVKSIEKSKAKSYRGSNASKLEIARPVRASTNRPRRASS